MMHKKWVESLMRVGVWCYVWCYVVTCFVVLCEADGGWGGGGGLACDVWRVGKEGERNGLLVVRVVARGWVRDGGCMGQGWTGLFLVCMMLRTLRSPWSSMGVCTHAACWQPRGAGCTLQQAAAARSGTLRARQGPGRPDNGCAYTELLCSSCPSIGLK